MTEAKQPEALRLAEILEDDYCPDWFYEQGVDEVAEELRRQHARIADLEAQLSAIGAGGVEPLRPRQCLHGISEPSGWMPIETAPKDGTLIVLGARNGVWLGKYLPVYRSGYRPENPWSSMLLNHDHMAERYTRPTHWMPLPPSPSSADEGGSKT